MLFAGRIVVCDRRAARHAQVVATLASWWQLGHTTSHKSCHLLLLICMSVDEQSAPTQTRSLFARKEKRKKNFSKKISPRMLFAGRNFVCDRRAARHAQVVATLASWWQLNHTISHKSCHLLLLICMSVDEQFAPT
jgi:hypothetical protein